MLSKSDYILPIIFEDILIQKTGINFTQNTLIYNAYFLLM